MRRLLPAALAWVLPTLVTAQGTRLTPSFSATEMYDGNLFVSASDPQASIVHRVGPRAEIERRSAAFSLVGRHEIDVEYLHALPEGGIQFARQLGSIKLRHRPDRRLALVADAAYVDTRAPVELGPVTGFDQGRVRGRHLSIGPGVEYEVGPRTLTDASYEFARDAIVDTDTDAHVARAGVAYRFTRADTGSARGLFREYVFDGDTTAPSQVVLLGWTRQFARRTSASLHAGPRFRHVEVEGVEATASLGQGVGPVELEADYTRAEATSIGLPGSLETDAATFSVTLRLEPSELRARATLAQTRGPALEADVLDTRLAATTKIQPWLSIELSLGLTWQRLDTATAPVTGGAASGKGEQVFHDVVALTLVAAPPKPLEL